METPRYRPKKKLSQKIPATAKPQTATKSSHPNFPRRGIRVTGV